MHGIRMLVSEIDMTITFTTTIIINIIIMFRSEKNMPEGLRTFSWYAQSSTVYMGISKVTKSSRFDRSLDAVELAKQMLDMTEVVLKSFKRAGLCEYGGIVAVIYERRDGQVMSIHCWLKTPVTGKLPKKSN